MMIANSLTLLAAAAMALAAFDDDARAKELARLAGTWRLVSVETAEGAFPRGDLPEASFTIDESGVSTVRAPQGEFKTRNVVDPSQTPKTIDIEHLGGMLQGQTQHGIYKVEGDRWTMVCAPPDSKPEDRPRSFDATTALGTGVIVWERVKSHPPPRQDRPNIVWLTSEDHGPHMGCYGDRYATTPHVDRLAARGMIYTRAWSNAPVCAPARSTLIAGLYATSTGADPMRSLVPYPSGLKMFPQLLREAGYYCTNNAKEDYNLAKPGAVWDDSSRMAHWRNRPRGQPFFAVFNSEKSHESKLRTPPPANGHDPAGVRVPAYHPDTPEVRKDWARYHDGVTQADADAGERLDELESAGMLDDTIVFYFGDHGSGMPRSKRWPYDSGLQVPLVVAIPEKWRHLAPEGYMPGGRSDRLVSFVDFGPTVLSLAGVQPPKWMQGHAFLGEFSTPAQPYLFGFRGRMDERQDLVRTVTDGNLVYVRNFMPHLIYGQHIDYMFQTRTTQVWKALHDQGKLTEAQDAFWNPKPPEELYDLRNDPDEVKNLVADPAYREDLERHRQAHRDHAKAILDVGFLPEGDRFRRSDGGSPYDMARKPGVYPFDRVFAAAWKASMLDPSDVPDLKSAMADEDPAVRYWGAMGLLMRGKSACRMAATELGEALDDPSPDVRIAAAEALGRHGSDADRSRALASLLSLADWSKNDVFTAMASLAAIDHLGPGTDETIKAIRSLPAKGPSPDPRYDSYIPRLLEDLGQ